jgi:DNA-3-methyladenine glycosylase II
MVDGMRAVATWPLSVSPPFHLEGTVRLLQRQPGNRVDRWEDGRYVRVLSTREGLRLVAVENRGTIDAPDVRCLVAGSPLAPPTQEEVRSTVRRVLGLEVDLTPFYQRASEVPWLQDATTALRGTRPPRFPTLFETIVNVIPFQQVSLAAGVAVVGRIVVRFGQTLTLDRQTFYAFPTPKAVAAVDAQELRLLGLSRTKAVVLHDLALRVLAGELDEERLDALSTEAAMRTLTALPGIGPWSAGLILLRGLRRLDVFPAGDVGAAHNLARLLALDRTTSLADLQPYIERMGSLKGLLYFSALGWRLVEEGLIAPAPGPASCGYPHASSSRRSGKEA